MEDSDVAVGASEWTEESCCPTELSTLPDDVLEKVLSYCSAVELLQCRTVCRRWRALALRPCLWRNKEMTWICTKHVPTALRVAPCLDTLRLCGDFEKTVVEWGLLLSRTCCAVANLGIHFNAADAGFASMVLARQVSLGRLKRVTLTVNDKKPSKFRLAALLKQLVQIAGLESILVEAWNHPKLPHFPSAALVGVAVPPASLRCLDYGVQSSDECLALYLEWHADTLEDVSFMGGASDPRVASLLSSMPHLRALRCPLLVNMAALLPCPSLKTLHLNVYVNDSNRQCLPGARAFLRSAVSHLEGLVLDYGDVDEDDEDDADALSLLPCLGGTETAAATLQDVKFLLYGEDNAPHVARGSPPMLQPLASVLHRLPRLRYLDIGGAPSDAFLEALDGQVLPELRELTVYTSLEFKHERLHSNQVRMVMRRCPRLHLSVIPASDDDERIECHHCPTLEEHTYSTLFTHPEGAPCGQLHLEHDIFISLD